MLFCQWLKTQHKSTYLQAKYNNWSGAYDLSALAKLSDFVTIMAYDQHTDTTTPGPVASYVWDQALIKDALKSTSRDKLSMGVPVYSSYWATRPYATCNTRLNIGIATQQTYAEAEAIIQKNKAILYWDNLGKVNFTFFSMNQLYSYLFIENAHSFRFKYFLAKSNHIQGVSVFSLGSEDPEIWKSIH